MTEPTKSTPAEPVKPPYQFKLGEWCGRPAYIVTGDHYEDDEQEDDCDEIVHRSICVVVGIVPIPDNSGDIPRMTAELICNSVNATVSVAARDERINGLEAERKQIMLAILGKDEPAWPASFIQEVDAEQQKKIAELEQQLAAALARAERAEKALATLMEACRQSFPERFDLIRQRLACTDPATKNLQAFYDREDLKWAHAELDRIQEAARLETAASDPKFTVKEFIAKLRGMGIETAGYLGNSVRWSITDLETDLTAQLERNS